MTLTGLYDTSADDLWDALTNRDASRGGSCRFRATSSWAENMTQGKCGRDDHRLRAADAFRATGIGGAAEWIDVKVTADRDKARMTLEHTAIIEDHWTQFGPGAVGIGWDLAVVGLERNIWRPGFGRPRRRRGMDGFAGRQGVHERERRVLARGACRGGVDPPGQGRSDRTIAFYRGEPPPDWHTRAQEADARLRRPLRSGAPSHPRVARPRRDGVRRSRRGDRGRVRITQAAVSQHLKVLRESGLHGFARTRSGGSIGGSAGPRRSTRGSASSDALGAEARRLATEIARGQTRAAQRAGKRESRQARLNRLAERAQRCQSAMPESSCLRGPPCRSIDIAGDEVFQQQAAMPIGAGATASEPSPFSFQFLPFIVGR